MSSEDSECSQNGSRVNSESNPNYNADINQIASSHSQLYKALPLQIRRRIKALKKLQLESVRIESEFFVEVHKLECKYNELYSGVYKTRRDIVSGEKEPTEEECDFPFDDILDDSVQSEDNKEPGFSPYGAVDLNTKGIPYFWLTIFKNVDLLNDMVQPHDEPILKHLIDIQVDLLEKDPMGFVLKFIFSPNEYFSNTVLTKSYEMRCKPDESDPFSFEGPEIIKCKGCTIDWHKNKNVTQRTIKKKQKQKSQSTKRIITTTVKNDSFFNFFNPPHVPEDEDEDVDGDTQDILTIDFEIGHSIRERIVPHAVLWFTGEALDEDFEEEEEEEEEDDDDNEITDNSDEQPAVVVRRRDLKNHRQMRHSRKQFIDDITDDSEDENAKIVPRPKGKKGKKIAQPGPECAQM